ncbi:uncharacterized protein LOC126988006 isoform X1 [Eriocheir sinensis]|uniref:uncharacterized protein LOC126988006 isoform X1 n=1 Tax=Eriocheir sinensis TaxID=95602 RepID=UPI0021C7043E|nr:uncharacterized protein LOC126988006 isoform X1 [Eriocheir sinensis]
MCELGCRNVYEKLARVPTSYIGLHRLRILLPVIGRATQIPFSVTERPGQRHVTVLAAVVVAAWAASCLPGAHALKLWVDPRGYFQYLMTKECFGEEVALQQEKEAMQHAEYCARQAQGKDPAKSVATIKQNVIHLKGDYGGINHTPARRSLVNLPRNPTLEAMICNLRQFRLLTGDNQVNVTAIEDRLGAMKIDPQLKLDLLESAIQCRPSLTASSQREDSSDRAALLSAMLAVARYQGCIGIKTHSICKEFVRGRVASKLHL